MAFCFEILGFLLEFDDWIMWLLEIDMGLISLLFLANEGREKPN